MAPTSDASTVDAAVADAEADRAMAGRAPTLDAMSGEPNPAAVRRPWEAPVPDETATVPRVPLRDRLLPVIGPVVLFIV